MLSKDDIVLIKSFKTKSLSRYAQHIVQHAPAGLLGTVTNVNGPLGYQNKPITVRVVWEGYKDITGNGNNTFVWHFNEEDLELVYSG